MYTQQRYYATYEMYMIKCDNMSRDMSIICPQFMSNDNMSINDRIKIY